MYLTTVSHCMSDVSPNFSYKLVISSCLPTFPSILLCTCLPSKTSIHSFSIPTVDNQKAKPRLSSCPALIIVRSLAAVARLACVLRHAAVLASFTERITTCNRVGLKRGTARSMEHVLAGRHSPVAVIGDGYCNSSIDLSLKKSTVSS